MSTNIPLLEEENLDAETILTPPEYVSWMEEIKILPKIKVPECCLFAYDNEILPILRAKYLLEENPLWAGFHSTLLTLTTQEGLKIAVVSKTVGAPFAAMTMEELICCGGKYFLSIGAAGLLQKDIHLPCLLIPTRAIRDEGTSYHYVPPAKYIDVDNEAVEVLKQVCLDLGASPYLGTTWTTDALYRETLRKCSKYREEGVLSVDMEVAALAAVSKHRNVKFSGLFYISDKVEEDKSQFAKHTREVLMGQDFVSDIAIAYFTSIAARY